MRKNLYHHINLLFILVFVVFFCVPASAQRPRNIPSMARKTPKPSCQGCIAIESDLSDSLVQFAESNAMLFFKTINETYFKAELNEPLRIYLSNSADESRKLIDLHGRVSEAGNGFYIPSVAAVYPYLTDVNEKGVTLEPLFASVAEHFVSRQYPNAPEWFRTGLVSFLSKNTLIVNGKLVHTGLCPQSALILRNGIEADTRFNIKKLYVSSDERYHAWESGPAFTQAFFCWLEENGYLTDYLQAVYKEGYGLEVLEKTIGTSAGRINVDLKRYIENECYIAALLADADQSQQSEEKERILQTVLEKKSDYPAAQIALARLYYQEGMYGLCRKVLTPILARPESAEFIHAARLAGKIYYDESNYLEAKQYYEKAWDAAQNYAYKYQIAYNIANCCHHLGDAQAAATWYGKFLELNFMGEDETPAINYATKYVELFSKKTASN